MSAPVTDTVGVDLSTVSRQVAALESAGWVTRERDGADGRVSLIGVTDAGRAALDRTLEARRAQLAELLGSWTDEERGQLATLLGRLNRTIEERSSARTENA